MNFILKIKLLLVLLMGISAFAQAKVILPGLMSDNMVLQQQQDVMLWGKASGKAQIKVTTSWDKRITAAGIDKEGTWRVRVRTPQAGGPYQITFDDGEKLVLNNILIGEVWVCSGQSNMEIPVKGYLNQPVLHANKLLAEAEEYPVRLFKVERNLSARPVDDIAASWEIANAKSVSGFSAVGYQFAKILTQRLHVPVGIIEAAWGGTNIIGWMNANAIKAFPEYAIPPDTISHNNLKSYMPTALYNAMIHPLLKYKIRGVIWYQGESNRRKPSNYALLMKSMVSEWRREWNIGEWPFYYVQIAPWEYGNSYAENVPYIREAQYKAMELIPNSGMVVSLDAGSKTTIHPPNKTVISERLACWALAMTYGKSGIAYQSPVFKSVSYKNNVANILFEHAEGGLSTPGEAISGFEIAGRDSVFHPAKAQITKTGISVVSENVKEPVAVRYGFKDWAEGSLYNNYELPVAPFRSDSWPVPEENK